MAACFGVWRDQQARNRDGQLKIRTSRVPQEWQGWIPLPLLLIESIESTKGTSSACSGII